MRNKKKHALYIVLISSLSLFFLSSCAEDNAEKALKRALAELVSAVENKQFRSVTQKLTSHFRGNKRLNQQTMSALVFRYTLQHKFIKIYTVVNTIEVAKNKKEANMLFHALLTGTKSTLPEHMRAFKVQSDWLKADNEWKIKEANWIEVRAQTVYPRIKNNHPILNKPEN